MLPVDLLHHHHREQTFLYALLTKVFTFINLLVWLCQLTFLVPIIGLLALVGIPLPFLSHLNHTEDFRQPFYTYLPIFWLVLFHSYESSHKKIIHLQAILVQVLQDPYKLAFPPHSLPHPHSSQTLTNEPWPILIFYFIHLFLASTLLNLIWLLDSSFYLNFSFSSRISFWIYAYLPFLYPQLSIISYLPLFLFLYLFLFPCLFLFLYLSYPYPFLQLFPFPSLSLSLFPSPYLCPFPYPFPFIFVYPILNPFLLLCQYL